MRLVTLPFSSCSAGKSISNANNKFGFGTISGVTITFVRYRSILETAVSEVHLFAVEHRKPGLIRAVYGALDSSFMAEDEFQLTYCGWRWNDVFCVVSRLDSDRVL